MTWLRILFSVILVGMVFVTTTASLEQSIGEAARVLWPDAWFRATLADAYFGFLTIFVWIAYKERSVVARIVWFALVMALGNIAISIYLLIQLRQLRRGDSVDRLLLRTASSQT